MSDPISINLVKSRKPHFLDRFITWALNAGRLLVIITETVALSAFLFRFGLDREIVDLNDKIKQNKNIVFFLQKEEIKFRNLQQRLSLAHTVIAAEKKTSTTYADILAVIPKDATLEGITFLQDTISIELSTRSLPSIGLFTKQLKDYPSIGQVSLDSIENKTTTGEFLVKVSAEKIANLRTLQDNYTQIQENIPVVLDAIPTAPTIPLFTAYVQGAVTQSRVKLVILQTLPVEFTADAPPHAYMSFAFSLTAEGTTGNIDTFLTSLQSFARLVTIDEFSIRKTPDNLNLFQLTVKGKAYFKKV